MRAISLWQPWAGLIATGHKTIETRTWSTNVRGELLIHAAKKKFNWTAWYSIKANIPGFASLFMFENIYQAYGKILCKVNLVDCVPWEPKHLQASCIDATGGYAWILEDIVPFENLIPWRGSQGFFNVELPNVEGG